MAHASDFGGWNMTEHIAVEMNHAPLPTGVWQILSTAFHQTTAGVGNEKSHALEAALDEVAEDGGPTRFIILGPLTIPQDLPETFGSNGTRHEQGDIAYLVRSAALHYNAVEVQIGMLARDGTVPPDIDLGVNLLVQV